MSRLIRLLLCSLLLPLIGCGHLAPAESEATIVHPVMLTRDQVGPKIFSDYESVITQRESGDQSWRTEDVEAFVSSDRKFDAGIYRSGPVLLVDDEEYGVDEFMYFLEGGVILTSIDGTKLEVGPGDAVIIPKEWRGTWHTPEGYLKIYVIHFPEPME
jgi:uncharacterized cupin superfamily protein